MVNAIGERFFDENLIEDAKRITAALKLTYITTGCPVCHSPNIQWQDDELVGCGNCGHAYVPHEDGIAIEVPVAENALPGFLLTPIGAMRLRRALAIRFGELRVIIWGNDPQVSVDLLRYDGNEIADAIMIASIIDEDYERAEASAVLIAARRALAKGWLDERD